MQIFIQRDGVQQGPYSHDAVRSLVKDGNLLRSDLARLEAGGRWMLLETVPGILDDPALSTPTSALAVWSLILGILGIFALGIPSIPAIFCGHLSLGKIKRSPGKLTGKGLAIAGVVLGYIGLTLGALLIPAGLIGGPAAVKKAKKVTTLATAMAIESAVGNFYHEYGSMPSETKITDTSKDVSLVKTLLGDDPTKNKREIRFLAVKEGRQNKNGLDPVTFRIFDSWGHGYQVVLDTGYAEEVVVTRGGITETLKGRRAAVFSLGKDGIAGTSDDVLTW